MRNSILPRRFDEASDQEVVDAIRSVPKHFSTTPHEAAQIAIGGGGLFPVGGGLGTSPFAQTFDRRLCNNITFQPTSGQLTMTAIWLAAGQIVTGITFVSGATAESGGTHLWYALYQANLTFMAQSTDDAGATSFGANTAFRKALTAPQTCPLIPSEEPEPVSIVKTEPLRRFERTTPERRARRTLSHDEFLHRASGLVRNVA